MTQPISVVIPVYNGVTQLDFTGPHQVLCRAGQMVAPGQARVIFAPPGPSTG